MGMQSSLCLLAVTRGCCSLFWEMALAGRQPATARRINELDSDYSRCLENQRRPQGSSEGLLPAGPGARGTFCYPEAAGAESRPRPAVSPPRATLLGTASALGRHRRRDAAVLLEGRAALTERPRTDFARLAPSVLPTLWPWLSAGGCWERRRARSARRGLLLRPS